MFLTFSALFALSSSSFFRQVALYNKGVFRTLYKADRSSTFPQYQTSTWFPGLATSQQTWAFSEFTESPDNVSSLDQVKSRTYRLPGANMLFIESSLTKAKVDEFLGSTKWFVLIDIHC